MTLGMIEDVVAFGYDRASLDAIARPRAALAIWWRSLSPALLSSLATLDLDAIDKLSLDLDAEGTLDAALRDAGYSEPVVAPLAEDIGLLVRRHAALTGEDRLHVRLEVVETDAGRGFHADHVPLRLRCTYLGPGTQWCRAAAPDGICEVPTGMVSVFKGRMLLDPPTILHRAPPIAGAGEQRLVLTIDPR